MRILTGIQPSGTAHLGNLFGALLPAIKLSKEHEIIIFLADLHALTSVHNAQKLHQETINLVLDLLALGLNPEKCIFFKQSSVPAHAQLAWVLSTLSPMGLLERATSFKDKVANGLPASVGLFTYPILQAADILLYSPQAVPVGKDQKQHLEITRDLAAKFNHVYGETFILPEPIIAEETGLVPGPDGRKMSKSYHNAIDIFSDSKTLKKQIMSIQTDSKGVNEPKDVGNSTICALYKLFVDNQQYHDFRAKFARGGVGYGDAKKQLLEIAENYLSPLRDKRAEWVSREDEVEQILDKGAIKANKIAEAKLTEVYQKVGLQ